MSSSPFTHLPDLNTARVNTAGAYISIGGLFPFAIGWELHNGNIPVVRLGGHVIDQETGWECTLREVKEEASIRIEAIQPGCTYWISAAELKQEPNQFTWQEYPWMGEGNRSPYPFLVIYDNLTAPLLSVMYLARSGEVPTPSGEVKGMVLLERADVCLICHAWACQTPITLGQYLKNGGKAILNEPFELDRSLEPFNQLRILARLMDHI